jgi:hypothetical protein
MDYIFLLVLHIFSGKRKPCFLKWSFCVPQNEVFVLVLWHTEQQFLKSCEEPFYF